MMNEIQINNNSNNIKAKKIYDSLSIGDEIQYINNVTKRLINTTIIGKKEFPKDPWFKIETKNDSLVYGSPSNMEHWDIEFLSIKKMNKINEAKQELYYDLYTCYSIIKTSKDINKVDIINAIRGVEGVVTVDVDKQHQSKFLMSPAGANYEKTLIKIKYLVEGSAEEDIMKIKADAIKIQGLQSFMTIKRSITKL